MANTDNTLFSFAICGKEEDFNNKINYLSNMAEEEVWDLHNKNGIDILRKYIFTTFSRCKEQNKIIYSSDNQFCTANTGLLTENGKEILMVFTANKYIDEFDKEKSATMRDWYFNGFKTTSDRVFMDVFKGNVPELATYTDNVQDYYFDPNLPIEVDIDHVVDDNIERIQEEVPLQKPIIKMMLTGVVDIALKKAKRNFRLVIPQYYQDKIGFLIPLEFPIGDDKTKTMALAVEKMDGLYRANTIFNKDDAYAKARILMRPDTNWLLK